MLSEAKALADQGLQRPKFAERRAQKWLVARRDARGDVYALKAPSEIGSPAPAVRNSGGLADGPQRQILHSGDHAALTSNWDENSAYQTHA